MASNAKPPDNARLDRIVADARRASDSRATGYREQALKIYAEFVGKQHEADIRDDDLERRRHSLVRVSLRGARRGGARLCLGVEPPLDQAVHEREEGAEPVARRPDAIGAHERGI